MRIMVPRFLYRISFSVYCEILFSDSCFGDCAFVGLSF